MTGHIDHPLGGSKDLADSLARSVWNLTNHAKIDNVPRQEVFRAISSVNNNRVVGAPASLSQAFQNLYK